MTRPRDRSMAIIVNARFLAHSITGVERHGREILARVEDRVQPVAPARGAEGLPGHLWEQLVLPGLVGRADVLWSPANTGPLRVRRQVVTIHDLAPIDHPEWYARGFATWYGALLPRLAARAARIIVVSQFTRDCLLDRFRIHPDRIVVVPNGVSELFHAASPETVDAVRARYGLPAAYLLAVGSLQPRKNLEAIFAAWRALEPTSSAALVVAGATRSTFRSAGFAAPPRGTILLGRVEDEDLPALYSGALALVYPSRYEGFGLPVLEAMACGTPVIASTAGALPEVAGDAALLIDPCDEDALRHAMATLVSDDALRADLRTRGLRHAGRYSWTAAAQRTLEVLDAV